MERKKCFMVCPIGEEGSDVRKNSDDVLKYLITPVLSEKGYEVIRADKILDSDTITDTILDLLKQADLVIADLTGKNPNVFYELGYRAALNLPIIQIITEGQSIPFDVSGIRTHSYNIHEMSKVDSFKANLKGIIDTIETKIATQKAEGVMPSGAESKPFDIDFFIPNLSERHGSLQMVSMSVVNNGDKRISLTKISIEQNGKTFDISSDNASKASLRRGDQTLLESAVLPISIGEGDCFRGFFKIDDIQSGPLHSGEAIVRIFTTNGECSKEITLPPTSTMSLFRSNL